MRVVSSVNKCLVLFWMAGLALSGVPGSLAFTATTVALRSHQSRLGLTAGNCLRQKVKSPTFGAAARKTVLGGLRSQASSTAFKGKLEKIFALIDTDGSGRIEREELQAAVEVLGLRPTREELEESADQMDGDGDGTIDFSEFCKAMEETADAFDMTPAAFSDTLLSALQPTATPARAANQPQTSSSVRSAQEQDMFIPIFVGVAAGGYSLILAWEWFRLNFLEN